VWHDKDKEGIILFEEVQNESGSPPTKKIKAATLNGLLLHLVSDNKIDLQYMDVLALTYRSFISPEDLFHKLIELYDAPAKAETLVIQSKVSTFLKRWITAQFPDFPEDLVHEIHVWISDVIQTAQASFAKQLLELIATKAQERVQLRQTLIAAAQPKEAYDDISPARFVLDVDPQEIASQLTIIDHLIYSSIRPHELLFQAWNKPQLKHRAPNVLRMISRTNNVALWVASSILWNPKLVDRTNAMVRLIQVAEHLRKVNNFNTMFAIISGLQLSSINRLKFTREKIPKKIQQTFDSLVELMNNQRSFKVYRDTLAAQTPPCIPYLGVYLTDLTFIEDGNHDYLTPSGAPYQPPANNPSPPKRQSASASPVPRKTTPPAPRKTTPLPVKKAYSPPKLPERNTTQPSEKAAPAAATIILINMKKRELQSKVINEIQVYQNWKYSLKEKSTPLLEELPRNEEDQLYGLSLLREPRDANKDQLV
jgi:son of sevenless-like protein